MPLGGITVRKFTIKTDLPRDTVCCLVNFIQKEEILRLARSHANLEHKGARIQLFQDLSCITTQKGPAPTSTSPARQTYPLSLEDPPLSSDNGWKPHSITQNTCRAAAVLQHPWHPSCQCSWMVSLDPHPVWWHPKIAEESTKTSQTFCWHPTTNARRYGDRKEPPGLAIVFSATDWSLLTQGTVR